MRQKSNSQIVGMIVGSLLVSAALVASAESNSVSIGRAAAVEGPVEVNTGSGWMSLADGSELIAGSRIRTGSSGTVELLLLPDNSIKVVESSEITIERHVFDRERDRYDTFLSLLSGQIRGSANAAYEAESASFQIASPVALVRVLGGEFTVGHSADRGITDVFGERGRQMVHSTLDPTARAVLVTAQHATRVKKGEAPEPAYLTRSIAVELLGAPSADASVQTLMESAVWVNNPVLSGGPRVDLQPGAGLPSQGGGKDTGSVLGQPPAALTGPGRLLVDIEVD